ncbi:MAG: hypothetical protein A3E68_02500 [Candidatus Levybacteria bacterium RIFCSPHIGHO2_12_FULL_39_39]|nr:MAG: hypothetical protein A3E68_02500 [Candidatus Levybacteria bacterium RIFCSPHIGHO2_12_FULL_39_39]OGH45128.1 MAG: hypothetical protein A3H82_01190 [Candidatus Levybacteria bacterium RIFCSPLOWO2_02_FULL_39_26]OGH47297.1 MAG: hypothetical protein A3G66_03605 [Candidatus Levybacteria bacterium RIFCSPLOWO2_12_FULL_39_17]
MSQINISNLKARASRLFIAIGAALLLSMIMNFNFVSKSIISPLANDRHTESVQGKQETYEIFGFAPYWTINKLENVDFNVLTTLAYFGIPVKTNGTLDTSDTGYQVFKSPKATALFEKAHSHGTKVVLTLTQMNNSTIKSFLDDKNAQKKAINEAVKLVKERGIDGLNIDFEYTGNPGREYKDKFSSFVALAKKKLSQEIPGSRLSVSVYASSAKAPKMYDIAAISKSSDSIFMMAYDFATAGADVVIPTAPLYGYREGKYWYDIATAVEDFLKVMPAEKLILGLPWYGYNYPVSSPGVKVARYQGYSYYYWWGRRRYRAYYRPPASAQTYANAINNIEEDASGWDDYGKVGWKAYKEGGIWRMIFLDDSKSLKIKYQFAKEKNLAGVGMWALGFDDGKHELWNLLNLEFGNMLARK